MPAPRDLRMRHVDAFHVQLRISTSRACATSRKRVLATMSADRRSSSKDANHTRKTHRSDKERLEARSPRSSLRTQHQAPDRRLLLSP
jgi:hypothetical protein